MVPARKLTSLAEPGVTHMEVALILNHLRGFQIIHGPIRLAIIMDNDKVNGN